MHVGSMTRGASTVEEKPGICGICPAGCWVKVGVEDGKLVSIEPDQGHPLGMICRRGQHAPIPELAALAREHGALFHTDAVQAAGKLSLDVEELGWTS